MGKAIQSVSTTATVGAGSTVFCAPSGVNINTVVEARAQVRFRSAGTIRGLSIVVATNATTANSTCRTRINGANGNQLITIPSATTGNFQDTTNSDSVVASDLVCTTVVNGGGGTILVSNIMFEFDATTNTVIKNVSCADVNFSTASATVFAPLGGSLIWGTVEADTQARVRAAGTLKNLAIHIRTNGRSTSSTLVSRLNGANGNLSITIASLTTGILEDTTNSDTLASADLSNFQLTTGTGTGNLNINTCGADYETTDSKFQMVGGFSTGTALTGATRFLSFGNSSQGHTTEARAATTMPFAFTARNLGIYCSANATTGASTVDLRVNNASSAVTISVGAGLTGWFEDTTNSVSITTSDVACWRIASGSGGSATWHTITMVGETSAPPPATQRSYGFVI